MHHFTLCPPPLPSQDEKSPSFTFRRQVLAPPTETALFPVTLPITLKLKIQQSAVNRGLNRLSAGDPESVLDE